MTAQCNYFDKAQGGRCRLDAHGPDVPHKLLIMVDTPSEPDLVNHPPHYTSHPSGIECIDVVEHMGFNLGNAIKYIWRADLKHDAIEDLRKAAWYLNREIERRTGWPA